MAIGRSRSQKRAAAGELPIAPMVDVVFLLLIYFMVSSSIEKQEADIGFALPAVVRHSEPVAFPDEQIVEIDEAGRAWVNGYGYDDPESASYRELAKTLSRYRQAAGSEQSVAKVVLAPADGAAHENVVKVMDACTAAGIASLSFASQ